MINEFNQNTSCDLLQQIFPMEDGWIYLFIYLLFKHEDV